MKAGWYVGCGDVEGGLEVVVGLCEEFLLECVGDEVLCLGGGEPAKVE